MRDLAAVQSQLPQLPNAGQNRRRLDELSAPAPAPVAMGPVRLVFYSDNWTPSAEISLVMTLGVLCHFMCLRLRGCQMAASITELACPKHDEHAQLCRQQPMHQANLHAEQLRCTLAQYPSNTSFDDVRG